MRILVSTSSFCEHDDSPLELLRDACMSVRTNPYGRTLTSHECLELYADIDGVIAGTEAITSEILESAKRLRVISRCGVGTDNVDMKAAEKLGIKVVATPDAPTEAVAELTLALILALRRNVPLGDRLIRSHTWQKNMGSLLSSSTIGILGMGRIGKRLVELMQPFALEYIAWDASPDRQFGVKHGIQFTGLDELLTRADIVTIHLPYAAELDGIIGDRALGLMRKEALLVNTARGKLVDEIALYKALKERRIAGAALDVFQQEPYFGPLAELNNVILTPHIGSYAKETRVRMEIEAARNLLVGLGCELPAPSTSVTGQ